MKTSTLVLAACVAFAFVELGNAQRSAPARASADRWEYATLLGLGGPRWSWSTAEQSELEELHALITKIGVTPPAADETSLVSFHNAVGSQGWELIIVHSPIRSGESVIPQYIYKRRLSR